MRGEGGQAWLCDVGVGIHWCYWCYWSYAGHQHEVGALGDSPCSGTFIISINKVEKWTMEIEAKRLAHGHAAGR